MSETERIYLKEHFPSCVFSNDKHHHAKDRKAVKWTVVVNEKGGIDFVVPLCALCYDGYHDLMQKTYGVK